jgi:hypothetical protein
MPEPRSDEPRVFKLFGLELPIERWAVHIIGAIVIASLIVFIGIHLFTEWTAVLSPQKANEQLADDISEYGLHAMETPEHEYTLFDDVRGKLAVRAFADGCLLIQRRNQVGTVTKLVRDLSRPSTPPKQTKLPEVVASLHAGGRCLDPHPGPFAWRYGQQQGCWIEVWRAWPDGCQHVQMFNVCSQTWDSNPNGTPRVRWTNCNH